MTLKQIPDVSYEISDDGELLTIEQGAVEASAVVLHRIHLQHFANVMKLRTDDDQAPPQLIEYLERINEQAASLYDCLSNIFDSSQGKESSDVTMARQLMQTANQALSFWGNN